MKILCWLGWHPFKGWRFVGSSWQPNDYVRVCRFCGKEA